MENHERKRIPGSRRELGTARSVGLAVLFMESLDRPADFRSLSADAPDDCGHPSVSASVFQVSELGRCPHQLVFHGESLGYSASSAVGYIHRRKRRGSNYSHWFETLHGLFSIATGSKRFMVYFEVLTGKLPEGAEENKNFCDFLR